VQLHQVDLHSEERLDELKEAKTSMGPFSFAGAKQKEQKHIKRQVEELTAKLAQHPKDRIRFNQQLHKLCICLRNTHVVFRRLEHATDNSKRELERTFAPLVSASKAFQTERYMWLQIAVLSKAASCISEHRSLHHMMHASTELANMVSHVSGNTVEDVPDEYKPLIRELDSKLKLVHQPLELVESKLEYFAKTLGIIKFMETFTKALFQKFVILCVRDGRIWKHMHREHMAMMCSSWCSYCPYARPSAEAWMKRNDVHPEKVRNKVTTVLTLTDIDFLVDLCKKTNLFSTANLFSTTRLDEENFKKSLRYYERHTAKGEAVTIK
jgi:thiol-disulfide isomerase/thioredoxin